MPLRAVIFDFDGVIADSERLHCEAFAEVLRARGHALTWDDYVSRLMPFDDRRVFEHFYAPLGGSPVPVATLVEEKAAVYERFLAAGRLRAFPDALALIQACHSAGLPLAVCTSSSRSEVEEALREFGVRAFFAVVISADDVTACKPDPQGYLLSVERLRARAPELRPEETAAIEDSLGGARAARAAGLRLLGVARVKTPPELTAAGADAVVPDLSATTPRTLAALAAALPERIA